MTTAQTKPPPSTPGADSRSVSLSETIQALVRATIDAVAQASRMSTTAIGDGVEGPGRALARRVTTGAVSQPRPVATRALLATALAEQRQGPAVGGTTAAALAAKLARRIGPLRFVARRTPMFVVIAVVPALHASVAKGADELGLVASHLVLRARAAGVVPDPERIRRVTVQLLTGAAVDPVSEARHAPLAVAWLQRAARAAVPFASGVATADPDALAAAASAVEPSLLGD